MTARQINTIYSYMVAGFISAAAAVGLTIVPQNWSTSDYKYWTLQTVSSAIAILEQIFVAFTQDVESAILVLPPQSPEWMKDRMINMFEYDATAVPILQFNTATFIPYYPNPNQNYRIVKYCSIVPGYGGSNIIKIAKQVNGLPAQITGTPLAAAQSFVNQIGVPGINNIVQSLNSDKLYLQIDVYYNGLYSAVIEAAVTAQIQAYLAGIDFDGVVDLSDLLVAVKAVAGVHSAEFINVQARANTTTVGTGTNLVKNKLHIFKDWQTVAGFIVLESTTGANWMLSDYRVGASGIKNLNLIAV